MKAVAWHGRDDVRVDTVPDPTIQQPNDAIVRITSTAICGSDLHLYEVLGAFMGEGDILGHEPMGIVEEVGPMVTHIKPGDRVVLPFNIACGHCAMCGVGLQSQCETTQVHSQGMGAALLGFSKLYGQVPGGQAELLRVPEAQYGPIKVPEEGAAFADERFLYLSDVLPTAWQGVKYAGVPDGGTLCVLGLGPIGLMAARIGLHLGYRVIGVDMVPERNQKARDSGIEVVEGSKSSADVANALRELTGGRGPDSVLDAVGMEAYGSPAGKAAQTVAEFLPAAVSAPFMSKAGVDRMGALLLAVDAVRRGGTISLTGVYGGQADPIPMLTLFDKQIQLRMGQANVKHWIDDLMPLLLDPSDPLGVENLKSHTLPLAEAPHGYDIFQKKQDGAIKVVLKP